MRQTVPAGVQHQPRQFDALAYRHNFIASRAFLIGPYQSPQGWQYRRWSAGERLPAVFWIPEQRLGDFWLFGLDIPPVGYSWVRFGTDALLIDLDSGEVVQAVYEIFL